MTVRSLLIRGVICSVGGLIVVLVSSTASGDDDTTIIPEESAPYPPTPTAPPRPTSPYDGMSEEERRTAYIRENAKSMGVPTPGPTASRKWLHENLGIPLDAPEPPDIDNLPDDPNVATYLPNGTPVYRWEITPAPEYEGGTDEDQDKIKSELKDLW